MVSAGTAAEDAGKRRKTPQRRTLNCLPCRQFKLKCNRQVPCESCIRHSRSELCLRNPPPQASSWSPKARTSRGLANTVAPRRPNVSTNSPDQLPPPQDLEWSTGLDRLNTTNNAVLGQHSHYVQEEQPTRQTSFFLPELCAGLVVKDDAAARIWTQQMLEPLPTQSQCDVLVSFYTQHIDWVYAVVNLQTFRQEYNLFWLSPNKTTLAWLGLLYAIVSVSSIYIPKEVFRILEFEVSNLEMAEVLYMASRQCLFASGCESNPTTTQIQSFIITQLYWHAKNDAETLYSCLGQTICAAQLLQLDRESEDEWRRRLWWEVCVADVSQAIHLGRRALTQAHKSSVSLPERPVNRYRARAVKLLSEAADATFEQMVQIDKELLKLQIIDAQAWERHLLHSSLHAHRIRLWSRFLATSLPSCVDAASRCFEMYRNLDRGSPKMKVQSWGDMGTLMILSVVLLVQSNPSIMEDVQLVLNDLEKLEMPITDSGTRVVRKLLSMYEFTTEKESESLLDQAYSLCGGKESLRDWLHRRCPVYYDQFSVEDFLQLEDLNLPLWLN